MGRPRAARRGRGSSRGRGKGRGVERGGGNGAHDETTVEETSEEPVVPPTKKSRGGRVAVEQQTLQRLAEKERQFKVCKVYL